MTPDDIRQRVRGPAPGAARPGGGPAPPARAARGLALRPVRGVREGGLRLPHRAEARPVLRPLDAQRRQGRLRLPRGLADGRGARAGEGLPGLPRGDAAACARSTSSSSSCSAGTRRPRPARAPGGWACPLSLRLEKVSYNRTLSFAVKAKDQVLPPRDEATRSEPRARMKAWVLGTAIALIALTVGSVFGDRGILNLVDKRRQVEALRGELEGLRAENARLVLRDRGAAHEPARDRAARARAARPRPPRRDRVPDPRGGRRRPVAERGGPSRETLEGSARNALRP